MNATGPRNLYSLAPNGTSSASEFGLVGDGTTDDTEALRRAMSSGRTVIFDESSTYSYDPATTLVVTPGTNLYLGNAILHERTSYDRPSIRIESNTYIDRLNVSVAGGAASRGVLIKGSDVHIGSMRLVARSRAATGSFRRRGLYIGDTPAASASRIRIDDIYLEGWDFALTVQEASDVVLKSVTIRSYRQGAWITNSNRVSIENGSADVVSPNAVGGPGENAVLVESTTSDSTYDIFVRNFQSYASGEHGFRIGGQVMVTRVTFDNCYATKAGFANGTGGSGFKVLGATGNSNNLARHSNITFDNCIVENTYSTKPGNNFTAFNVGKSRNVRIVNPIVRAAPVGGSFAESTYAAWAGVAIIGSENVDIVNPTIESCSFAGIHIFNVAEPAGGPAWGPDPSSINVYGGTISMCRRGIDIDIDGKTLRRLNVAGTYFNGGEHAVYATEVVLNRCYLEFTAISQSIGTTFGTGTAMGNLRGDFVGDVPMRTGSTFLDYGNYAKKIRKGTGWVAL